ncbi:MAG: 3-phosphoshikimate 1-carboxyvinyltransferase [Siphonobacter sp.]
MKKFLLRHTTVPFHTEVLLPASKSESNRAQILNALAGGTGSVTNLSEARDTQTMRRLLAENGSVADVLDAGTTMRFLTAYFAISGQKKVMTGTARMQERPIGILVDALRELGADISYQKNEGYPPLELNGFHYSGRPEISMRGDVSSQFISAIAMVAATLPEGLTINLTGALGSIPYIEMTLQQMRHFGAKVSADWKARKIVVEAQPYHSENFAVESDWSGASYWYSLVALGPAGSEVELLGLKENSLQGDSAIIDIMKQLGVKSDYTGRGFRLTQIPTQSVFEWDFTNCPDLAQTISVIAAAKGIPAVFTGIESLKVKETDRVLAIQQELRKFGADLIETIPNERYRINSEQANWNRPGTEIDTYDDHRMAMAFAPLAMCTDIVIENPEVVVKSYPRFWEDLSKILTIEEEATA